MTDQIKPNIARKPQKLSSPISADHYLRLILHRKWLVLGTFLVVSAATFIVAERMPNIYSSETVILVDPQKVPESYVKSTVTGDVRNRLGTLSQQILSATRLQKVIDSLNLYPVERKTLAREDIILKMRSDISVNVVSDFGGSQDLQAFRIRYSGRDAQLVARVANELASQFIDENLKARELQATGTTDFLGNQLDDARKTLEGQELKLRDFRLKHVGEMPEQQAADLQILGQLQSQLQLEAEAGARAQQQRSLTQALMTQSAPVVDVDEPAAPGQPRTGETKAAAAVAPKATKLTVLRAQLAAMEGRYTDQYPGVRRLRSQIADEEAREAQGKAAESNIAPAPPAAAPVETAAAVTETKPAQVRPRPRPAAYVNPVLESQLKSLEEEIAKHRQEEARLNKVIAGYQKKLESIPANEQQIASLVRDYDISKAHYQQLLNNQLSAETATQLEIRQKGEKFRTLDQAQAAERPSSPNRMLINAGGSMAGFALGLLLALITELLGTSITDPAQITELGLVPVLEVIPVIETHVERRIRKKRLVLATLSAGLLTVIASGAFLIYHLRT